MNISQVIEKFLPSQKEIPSSKTKFRPCKYCGDATKHTIKIEERQAPVCIECVKRRSK